jgi:hypothetical protein
VPDFERVIDQLRIDMADTRPDKAYWEGYAKGKTKARKEILYIAVAIYFLIAAIGAWSA